MYNLIWNLIMYFSVGNISSGPLCTLAITAALFKFSWSTQKLSVPWSVCISYSIKRPRIFQGIQQFFVNSSPAPAQLPRNTSVAVPTSVTTDSATLVNIGISLVWFYVIREIPILQTFSFTGTPLAQKVTQLRIVSTNIINLTIIILGKVKKICTYVKCNGSQQLPSLFF